MSGWCTNGWSHKYSGSGHCRKCGAERKWPAHKRPARKFLFNKESVDGWVHLDLLIQAWGTDLPPKRELLRCASNGTIHVWRDGEWYDDQFTQFTDHQQRKIHLRCWGRTSTYASISEVPRLRPGTRFRIKGTPEEDGLWRVATYRQGFVVALRILPDYTTLTQHSVRNNPWPSSPESSSSAPTESSITPPSSTETKTE